MNSWRGVGAFLPGPGQEIDGVFPFFEGEIGLAHVIVQRLHQFLEQEFRTRIRRLVEALDDGSGKFSLVELGHGAFALTFFSLAQAGSLEAFQGRGYTNRPGLVKRNRLGMAPPFRYQLSDKTPRRN
ncbi:hypothetical protein ACVIIV_006770 [Bradyrhizobium sp. USDA 4354]